MENTIEINEEKLREIKYHNLKEELEKLGVGSAFSAGKKKDVIIQDALKALAILKTLKKEGVADEDIAEKLEVEKLLKEDEAKAEAIKEQLVKETLEIKSLEKTKEKGLSREVLEKNLANIKSNLAMNINSHRLILLNKQKEIETILEGM